MENRPLILITNDDGYAAKGLRKLIALMRSVGDVVVVTTEAVMSSKSHSCSLFTRLYVRMIANEEGYMEYHCNGTPVDCVKLGYQKLLPRRPDLVVSGINHGSNAASTVVYSATVGAVVEACMDGIPAIAFSLDCFDADADFGHLDDAILGIVRKVLDEGLPEGVCLNVNFPARHSQPMKGIRICRHARCHWREFFDNHYDENGILYYDLAGEMVSNDYADDTDIYAIANNYASVVPTCFDWTAYGTLEKLKSFENL